MVCKSIFMKSLMIWQIVSECLSTKADSYSRPVWGTAAQPVLW